MLCCNPFRVSYVLLATSKCDGFWFTCSDDYKFYNMFDYSHGSTLALAYVVSSAILVTKMIVCYKTRVKIKMAGNGKTKTK
jgi:hypothetical protein